MSKIVLYGMDISPPVRACLLTLHALDIPFEYKEHNLFAGDHLSEEFLKRNPQKTIPILDDAGIWLWDSHAINCYLVSKYGKTDELYPKDLMQRARVDQRLHFDSSILFSILRFVAKPMWMQDCHQVPKEKSEYIIEGYDLCEAFLKESDFMVGNKVTIADFSTVATVSSLIGIIPLNETKYPNVAAWLKRMENLPYYEKANGVGNRKYVEILKSKLTDVQL